MLTAIILTRNEEAQIGRCLAALRPIADRIVIVDSFSTDRTVEIARSHGAEVMQHVFENYARQFQWALDHAQIATPWVMRVDADEVVEPDLAREINERLPTLNADVAGVNLKRKHIFMGRWIRHGGRYPLILLRIWRNGKGRIESRWMDEHMVVSGGTVVTFNGGFADENIKDLTFFTTKHNAYATREAVDVLIQRHALLPRDESLLEEDGLAHQAKIKRLIKENVYNRLPLWAGPLGYFLYRYVVQLGFLDGRPGLIYHVLQGFWYRFLVASKVVEYEAALKPISGRLERLEKLRAMTGLNLDARASGV